MVKSMITMKDKSFAIFDNAVFPEFLDGIAVRIETLAASKSITWMDELTDYTSQINDMPQKTMLTESAILSVVKQLWDTDKLNPEITTQWDGVFYNWARHVSQRGVELPTESTLQNRISVYEFYFKNQNAANGFCLPPQLQYELSIVLENGTSTTEEIIVDNPNLLQAAYSKLLSAKGFAIKCGGNLSDRLIAMMINNTVTIKEFNSQLAIEKAEEKGIDTLPKETETDTAAHQFIVANKINEDSNINTLEGNTEEMQDDGQDSREREGAGLVTSGDTIPLPETDYIVLDSPEDQGVHYQDGALMYTQDGVTVPVFIRATPQDGADHPLVEVGQQYILSRFGIHDPDLNTEVTQVEAPAFSFTENDTGVLTVNGYQFAEISVTDAFNLYHRLREKLFEVETEVTEKIEETEVMNEETEG